MRAKWLNLARPNQLPPTDPDWKTWLLLAGRGFGKTRTMVEDAAWQGVRAPGQRIAIVAATYADARDTCVEGESGLLSILPEECVDTWNRSIGELILWNGSRYRLFSADTPNRLRGPQHHHAYCDELAAWQDMDAYDQMLFGLRLGTNPKVVIATTPRPKPIIRTLVKDPETRVSSGSTFDNEKNLAKSAMDTLRKKYEGSRLGRQELNAEILEDVQGAIFSRSDIDKHRVLVAPPMQRIVVAVDPSGSDGKSEKADDIGIVAAGLGYDGNTYILADNSVNMGPAGWGRRVIETYGEYGADIVVGERNFGGAMVQYVVSTSARGQVVPYKEVVASRGKSVRASPVAVLYEQGRVKHVGAFPELEDQLCQFTDKGYVGEGSPDRGDAAVWAVTELMITEEFKPAVAQVGVYRKK